ncbi:hypothetical protein B0H67DRAFT_553859 [Lasiosphaeris hirsuta]|uniref:Uncharacterized protein n=1 Tax=Lasiosphaeris hirsuta TaxID=260670 RepID=A0AA40AG96_9PEZI|nr:hypothetical protein B0H67DRAFT_553859 [Lasiosphaeris hirsuta]
MPSYTRHESSSQSSSSRDSRSRRSNDSYASHSTTPTSLYTSPRPSEDIKTESSSGSHTYAHTHAHAAHQRYQPEYTYDDDVSPGTSLYPRSSIDTLASTTMSSSDVDTMEFDESPMDYEYNSIPPLPVYRREVVEPNVRASTPQDFAKLFPSLNRFTIRHDEFTPDGNMNLRVDTVVTGRRRTAIQLFHLRMYDLAKREFSLRRYCRDSGREVCNSKRKYVEPAAVKPKADPTRPTLKRSMSTAIKTLSGGKPVLRRAKSGAAAIGGTNRPGTSYSSSDGDDELFNDRSNLSALSLDSRGKSQRPMPTNTIKLEFSNYARVDVHRRGGKNNKRYEFEWWGHRYTWRRSVDKQLGGLVSFHLIRDGNTSAPVAHIVPETRSPIQVQADENAGGWVPPCFMWIADEAIVEAVTDVADVIMATGLMALVDDCIKERWQTKKVHRIPVPLTHKTVNLGHVAPRSFMQHMFGRRHSNDHHSNPPSPLRFANPIAAY